MNLALERATDDEVEAIAELRRAVADHLTKRHGGGPWSWSASERGVRSQLDRSAVYVIRERGAIVASLRLTFKRPWAIDPKYFTPVRRPLYLTDMAVAPARQRRGIGRRCLLDVPRVARELAGQSVRLDAYQAEGPGAGPFYRKCGFREVGRVSFRTVPLVYFEIMVAEEELVSTVRQRTADAR
jgi:GNAT superfamily N-acetyltransferase